ncbi:stage III sporulation ratchet engulfment protein SpoIIIAH [Bacillaceae bacterium]
MELKKQTVWLLTMLTVMVVLSAYYLLQGPTEQVPVAEQDNEAQPASEPGEIVIDTKELSSPPQGEEQGEPKGREAAQQTQPTANDSDFFIEYQMRRDALVEQQIEQYQNIIASDAAADVVAEATKKLQEIQSLHDASLNLEQLIKAQGYKEAVVIAKEDRVDVIVQADNLSKKEAVNIISLVTKTVNVPGKNVTVMVHP